MTETMKIVSYFAEQFYINIYNKWIHRHMSCVCTGSDYVEQLDESLTRNYCDVKKRHAVCQVGVRCVV